MSANPKWLCSEKASNMFSEAIEIRQPMLHVSALGHRKLSGGRRYGEVMGTWARDTL